MLMISNCSSNYAIEEYHLGIDLSTFQVQGQMITETETCDPILPQPHWHFHYTLTLAESNSEASRNLINTLRHAFLSETY